MNRRSPDDGGFVTVALVGLLLVLVAVASLVVSLGAVAVARHRAAATADLAALAAASHVLDGPGPACGRASVVARRQGGRLRLCVIEGLEVLVEVSVRPAGLLGRYGQAVSRSRAGPGRRS